LKEVNGYTGRLSRPVGMAHSLPKPVNIVGDLIFVSTHIGLETMRYNGCVYAVPGSRVRLLKPRVPIAIGKG